MKIIGIFGGHTTYELGPVSDVELFFNCLNVFAESAHPEINWSTLTDRLYRRYLLAEELDQACNLMERARAIFSSLPGSPVEWGFGVLQKQKETWLDINHNKLSCVFTKYFDSFVKAKGSAISFLNEFGTYQAVRMIPSEMPLSMLEKARPLSEYDALDSGDNPFWLRQ